MADQNNTAGTPQPPRPPRKPTPAPPRPPRKPAPAPPRPPVAKAPAAPTTERQRAADHTQVQQQTTEPEHTPVTGGTVAAPDGKAKGLKATQGEPKRKGGVKGKLMKLVYPDADNRPSRERDEEDAPAASSPKVDGDTVDDTVDERAGTGLHRIPAPGSDYRGKDRKVAITGRVIGIGALSALMLTTCGVASYKGVADTRLAANKDTLTAQDVEDKFHLSQFPEAAGSSFAGRYLELCLSRYPAGKNEGMNPQEEKRQEAVKRMSVAVSDQSCVPSSPGASSDGSRQVVSTTFTGDTTPVEGMSNAAFVTMQVTTDDGTVANYAVPVWFQNPAKGEGPRVVGPVGIAPLPRMGKGGVVKARVEDENLSQTLQADFIPQFMTAWYASSKGLNQFLAPGSSQAANSGLGDVFKKAQVVKVTAYPEKASQPKQAGGQFTYREGSTVEADVTVSSTADGSNVQAEQSYRVTLVRTNDHWFVKDVGAGIVGETQPDAGSAGKQSGVKQPSPTKSSSSSSPSSSSSSKSSSSSSKPSPSSSSSSEKK